MSDTEEPVPILYRIVGKGFTGFIRLVHATSRFSSDPDPLEQATEVEWPFIAGMWHGQFMMLPYANTARRPGNIMLAQHADAEVMGMALEAFGFRLIRGAGAGARKRDRGGAKALRAALTALKADEMVCMTVEVPPGPAREVSQGIIVLARMSGRPIKPIAAATTHAYALATWSRFTINLPFSRLAIVVGDPIFVPRSATPEQMEAKRLELQAALTAADEKAHAMVGRDPRKSFPPHLAPVPQAGLTLRAYRAATGGLSRFAGRILDSREAKGKEDPERRNERFGIAARPRPQGSLVWVHAASVGETNSVLPVITELVQARADLHVLLTTGTRTSAQLAADRLPPRAFHQYVPLDAAAFVRRFLEHWRPNLAVFTESEIWPNLILEAADQDVPVVIVNGRMSPKSYNKWARFRHSSHALFGRVSLALAQNSRTAMRFQRLGVRTVEAPGNLKVDAPPPPVDDVKLRPLRAATSGRPLLLAASTHPGEDDIVLAAHRLLRRHDPSHLTIIVPRHPERGIAIGQSAEQNGLRTALRSNGALPKPDTEIYIADTMGELGTFYSLAPVSFVGGSLVKHGGQNPIEAIKLGSVVLTGPHTDNFRDTYRALDAEDAVRRITSEQELAEAVQELLSNEKQRTELDANARKTVGEMSGALARTVDALLKRLPLAEGLPRAS